RNSGEVTAGAYGIAWESHPCFGSAQIKTPGQQPSVTLKKIPLAYVLVERLFNYITGHITHNLLLHLAALKDQQRRYASYVVTLRCDGAAVHIHFPHLDLALIRCRHFIHYWGQGLAGATPGSPEIKNHRLVTFEDHLVKVAVCYFQNAIARHESYLLCEFQSAGEAILPCSSLQNIGCYISY